MPDLVDGQEARLGVVSKKVKKQLGCLTDMVGRRLWSVHQASSTEKMGVPNSTLDAVVKNWSKKMVSFEALQTRHFLHRGSADQQVGNKTGGSKKSSQLKFNITAQHIL